MFRSASVCQMTQIVIRFRELIELCPNVFLMFMLTVADGIRATMTLSTRCILIIQFSLIGLAGFV